MNAKAQGSYLLRRNRVRCSLNDIQLAALDRLLDGGFYGQSRSEAIERILDERFRSVADFKAPSRAARHP